MSKIPLTAPNVLIATKTIQSASKKKICRVRRRRRIYVLISWGFIKPVWDFKWNKLWFLTWNCPCKPAEGFVRECDSNCSASQNFTRRKYCVECLKNTTMKRKRKLNYEWIIFVCAKILTYICEYIDDSDECARNGNCTW